VGRWLRRAVANSLALARDVVTRSAELQIVDRIYTIAAAMFVSLLPILLLLTGLVAGGQPTGPSPVATEIVQRLDLTGAAADTVRVLLPRGHGSFYALGFAITFYGMFTMSRRVARVYTAIWRLPDLRLAQLWRALIWLLLQVAAIISVGDLRSLGADARLPVKVGLYAAAVGIWFGTELAAQRLLTQGLVPAWRLAVAAGLVASARLLVAVWAAVYLAPSLTRQAGLYGPVGVVFSLFTSLFATIGATLLATLAAQILTKHRETTDPPAVPGIESPP
jgi:membrane protein